MSWYTRACMLILAALVGGCDCLLADGTAAEAGATSRLDALEIMLAEEKQLRIQLAAEVEQNRNACSCSGQSAVYPAFMATLDVALEHCTKDQRIVFDVVKTNVGGAYSNVHGVFTAPVAGSYMFTSTIAISPTNTFRTSFVKNNPTNKLRYLLGNLNDGGGWTQWSTSIVTHLDVNDEIWLICLQDSRIEGNYNHVLEGAGDFHSHISGFLIHPDSN